MNIEERLQKLTLQVGKLREKGLVLKWPDEVRKEALFLASHLGFAKVCKITTLHLPCLYKWRQDMSGRKKATLPAPNPEQILVTRLTVKHHETPSCYKEKPIALVAKDSVEFQIFCKDLALEIAQRVIL